jgi:hypothetical protein
MVEGKGRLLGSVAAGILSFVGALLPSGTAAEGPGAGDVKAAFVLNFMKFVEWPVSAFQSPEAPIVLAVLGHDPLATSFSSLDGKTVAGRRVVVRRVLALSELAACHVLFVGASEKEQLGSVLHRVQGWPTLTVADFEGFAGRGGMIGFTRRDERVGFEINEESARKAGVAVSAKLLYLGTSVRGGRGGER